MRDINYGMKSIIILILILSIQSCDNKKVRAKLVVKEWNQREILIPKNIIFKSIGRDTACSQILKHRNIVLVYIDSLGCAACKLRLTEWKTFIDTCQKMAYDVGFLFVVQSTNYKKFEDKLLLDNFTYPIIYDYNGEFNRLNKFPTEEDYRTLLLDRKNKVVLIGSPVKSQKMRKLFYKVIGGEKIDKIQVADLENSNSSIKKTCIQLSRDSVNIGAFSYNSTKRFSFQMKNIGKQLLIIQSINTSCGCTVAKFDKKPIVQGEATTVILEYKPNSLGYFTKTADVVCNVPEGYVRLKISGEVLEK